MWERCISEPGKQKPKSTTHIDPQVGTGGIVLAAEVLTGKGTARKYRQLLALCLRKARIDVLMFLRDFA